MKNKIFVLLLITSLSLVMFSCKDDEEKPAYVAMQGLVDGSNWKAVDPKAVLSNYNMTITGTSANGQTVRLYVNGGIIGDYMLGYGSDNFAYFIPNSSAGATYYSTDNNENALGMVKISDINTSSKTINGKFSFIGYKNNSTTRKTITEGTFVNVPYIFMIGGGFENKVRYRESGVNRIADIIHVNKSNNNITIDALCDPDESWQSVKLIIPASVGQGEHYITESGPVIVFFQKGFNTYMAESGTLIISDHDLDESRLTGSFAFDYIDEEGGTSTLQSITNGTFDVKYSESE